MGRGCNVSIQSLFHNMFFNLATDATHFHMTRLLTFTPIYALTLYMHNYLNSFFSLNQYFYIFNLLIINNIF